MSNTPTTPKPHHIVIAGGCHVNGFPIGSSFSFVRIMLQSDPEADPFTIAPINLRYCSSLLLHLREHPTDTLILQFGNYETMASIKKHLRAILHLRRKPHHTSSGSDADQQAASDANFLATTGWHLRVFLKRIYGYSLGLIHPRLFDARAFRQQAEKLLSDLEELQAGAPRLVVFLSPIPCADSLIRHYRHLAARILSNLCNNAPHNLPFQLRYFDTELALGLDSHKALSIGIFADDLHLNRNGHQILGSTLAAIMQLDPSFTMQQEQAHSIQ